MNMNKAASRHELVVSFKNPMLLFEMEQHCILRARDNQQSFLPSAGAFALIDGDLHERAGFATSVILHVLKNLFEVNPPDSDYGLTELCEHVSKMYPGGIPHDDVKFGLYLAQDFGVLSQYRPSDDGTHIESFRIAEAVVTIPEPEQLWRDRVQNTRRVGTIQAVAEVPAVFPFFMPDIDEVWPLLHPIISEIAMPRFAAGHYADAVEASLKAISEQVRNKSGIDEDGAPLMNKAFSPNAPILVLGDVQTLTGRSMQQGYMQIFAGAMTGIRNPKAHGNIDIDAIRCIHFLFFASLLAHKLDEVTIADLPESSAKSS